VPCNRDGMLAIMNATSLSLHTDTYNTLERVRNKYVDSRRSSRRSLKDTIVTASSGEPVRTESGTIISSRFLRNGTVPGIFFIGKQRLRS
jgi:hypothetical protein